MSSLCDPLDELTDEVVVTSSNSDVFHAPGDGGRTLCGIRHGHRSDLEYAPLRSVPCGHCFAESVVEKYQETAYRENGSGSSP
jgi:hypothetical protein